MMVWKLTLSTNPGMTVKEMLMEYAIALMSKEVIPGVKPMTLNELYKCDILYYIKLIRYSRGSTPLSQGNGTYILENGETYTNTVF